METVISEQSFRTARLEILSDITSASMGNASGFFCRNKGKLFLITNWHVVTARHPMTNGALNDEAAVPGSLKVSAQVVNEEIPLEGHKEGTKAFKGTKELTFTQLLKKGDANLWLEHPEYGKDVDVVAIPLPDERFGPVMSGAFDLEEEISNVQRLTVTSEVFIVGYPLTREKTNNQYPIYKSGTIASEPQIHDAEPRFHIDSKTKKGMSGSPVILRHALQMTHDGKGTIITEGQTNLIGIYSGRDGIAPTEYEAELGRVWPIKECLLPILDQAT